MKETIRRIDKLIKTCKWFSFAKYQKTGFEIADLIRSLFGTQNMYYKEYCSIVESKITSEDKGRYFVALLQAIKNHLIIQIGCDRRYQVFISSTYKDLIPYRNAVSECISFSGNIPAGMENFKANKNDPFEYIKRVIDESDYYILILGQRYGSFQDKENKLSFTFKEYLYALEKNKSILLFIYEGKDILPGNDLDKYGHLFNQVKAEVLKNHTANHFSDINELKIQVIQVLNDEIKNNPQKGWIRL